MEAVRRVKRGEQACVFRWGEAWNGWGRKPDGLTVKESPQYPARTHTTTREMIHDTILLHRTAVSPRRLSENPVNDLPPFPSRTLGLWLRRDTEARRPLLRALRWSERCCSLWIRAEPPPQTGALKGAAAGQRLASINPPSGLSNTHL